MDARLTCRPYMTITMGPGYMSSDTLGDDHRVAAADSPALSGNTLYVATPVMCFGVGFFAVKNANAVSPGTT